MPPPTTRRSSGSLLSWWRACALVPNVCGDPVVNLPEHSSLDVVVRPGTTDLLHEGYPQAVDGTDRPLDVRRGT